MVNQPYSETLSQADLARELAVSRPLVSKWLATGLLRALPDGRLDRREVFIRLRRHWCPSERWWRKPVPRDGLGDLLRETFRHDAEALLAEIGITENDLTLPEITQD